MKTKPHYDWAVIGAGPAGMAALGLLLDAGISPADVLWLDPEFGAGDLGRYWHQVSSNTKVSLFLDFLTQIASFNYSKRPQAFSIESLRPEGTCLLEAIAKPLQWVTTQLRNCVDNVKTLVTGMDYRSGAWQIATQTNEIYLANKVILATGCEANQLPFKNPNVEEIPLTIALNPSQLKERCRSNDRVAVFGSSHSAMIILRTLVEAGVDSIVNFYLSPIRFALPMGNWILYDNTGLKGETAQWVRDVLLTDKAPQITRYLSNEENLARELPHCQKAIGAIGFHRRSMRIPTINPDRYDESNGIIAPGLFGAGIAYPRAISDPNGNKEFNVGLWKFMNDIKKVMPIWLNY